MNKEAQREQILELRNKGFALRKIGKLFNLSGERIRQIIKGKVVIQKQEKYCLLCKELIVAKEGIRYQKHCQKCSEHLKHFSGRDMVREKVRMRDKYTCQECGKVWNDEMRRFDIHHLNGNCGKYSRKYDRSCDMSGLITLCHKCHMTKDEVLVKMKNRSSPRPNKPPHKTIRIIGETSTFKLCN